MRSPLLFLAALLLLTGCSRAPTSPASGASPHVIIMKNNRFQPKQVEIKAGTTLTWVNEDLVAHSVSEGQPGQPQRLFASPDFGKGERWSHTFAMPGTYEILCETAGHHLLGMVMKVVVR